VKFVFAPGVGIIKIKGSERLIHEITQTLHQPFFIFSQAQLGWRQSQALTVEAERVRRMQAGDLSGRPEVDTRPL
jgi:hypothetical protein